MTEILFAAYFALSCHNLGEVYKVPTEYRFGRGCYTARDTFLPRPVAKCWNCSVVVSEEAHDIMWRESRATSTTTTGKS